MFEYCCAFLLLELQLTTSMPLACIPLLKTNEYAKLTNKKKYVNAQGYKCLQLKSQLSG